MRIAVFSPFSGISGNMILGALIDCGLSVDAVVQGLSSLELSGWDLSAEKVLRKGLQGTHVQVAVPHEHEHRHLSDIRKIIDSAELPEWVTEKSIAAFTKLAGAEAAAHGIGIDEVHFHEVGAVDAIIDVVGSFLGLHLLGVEEVYSSAVAVGTGTVQCAHGVMPVPAPATARLLQGVPVLSTDIPFELTTPTGAAVLTTAVKAWGSIPEYAVLENGMGAGSRDNKSRANLLRLVIGETTATSSEQNDCIKIETLVDDLDSRIWPVLNEKILSAGALDCYARQCLGKKGRSALELVLLCSVEKKEALLRVIFAESSTLGVRISTVSRIVLRREFRSIQTSYGFIPVKLGYYDDRLVSLEPEFESCASVADVSGVPVKLVLQDARGAALKLLEN